jgi:hypothetical protein
MRKRTRRRRSMTWRRSPRSAGRSPRIRQAAIIARATAVLDPAEAQAAEALVLGRAGRLTPAGLRSAIARAVIEVAPDKARERRKKAEADARVGRGVRERRPGRPGTPARRGDGRRPADRVAGAAAEEGRAGRKHGRAASAGLHGFAAGHRLPAPPARRRQPGHRRRERRVPGQRGRRRAGRVRREDQPDHPAGHPTRPGRAAGRDPRPRPHRPESRSKYIGSLPERGISRSRYPARQRTGPLPRRAGNWVRHVH